MSARAETGRGAPLALTRRLGSNSCLNFFADRSVSRRIYNRRSIKTISTMMTITTMVPMPIYMGVASPGSAGGAGVFEATTRPGPG